MNETLSVLQHTLQASVSPYHCIMEASRQLEEAGFQPLTLTGTWNLKEEQGYYLPVFDSSLMAFTIGRQNGSMPSLRMEAAHTDWPCLKLKPSPEVTTGRYGKLNVEVYGGPILNTWMDRPLSMSGKVCIAGSDPFTPDVRFINFKRPLLTVPNLAIHMNRQVNDGYAYNAQKDMLPVFGSLEAKGTFMSLIAEAAGVKEEDILGHDLFLYNRQPGTIWGADETFLSCGRLDDLQCAFSSVKAVIEGENSSSISVAAIFDNEEVGSGTKQGADSTFLKDVLERINDSLGRTREQYLMAVASSFMISADNAHAVHPNHADVADPTNRPAINEGIVIKYNANQKYTTDAVSAAVFKALCKKVQVPVQTFTNRSDIAGGSTLGNISNAHVSLNTVDIGLPQFAMHSPYETAGVKDTCYLIKAATEFFNSCIVAEGNGNYSLGE